VVVFTGAGVSAESGVPTFRSDANSLWNAVDVRNFAYPDGYRRNQPDAWRWYAQRAAKAKEVAPNAGHFAIAEIERRVPEFLLVTQNIDTLHQRAGSENVLELHGNLREVRCFECGARSEWPEVASLPDPVCDACGGLLRPDVVMFEEVLPAGAMERAQEAARDCDLLLSVGTSNLVWPAAELPRYALRSGAAVVIINPDMSGQPLGARVIPLAGSSGAILPQLVRLAWPEDR
jgi:NAD-dependent deacetylase